MELMTRAGLALVLWGTVSIAPATAQQSEAAAISHFLSVPWGATAEELIQRVGAPFLDQRGADSVRVLIYREEIQQVPVLRLFYFDPEFGLVKGIHTIPYGPGGDCEPVFERMKERVMKLHPALPHHETRRNDEPATPFCDALRAGKAEWSVRWEDNGGNSVLMVLEPDAGHVDVIYQSRFFRTPAPADSTR